MKALFSHYKKLHLWLLANLALLSAFLLARRSRGAMNALTEGFTNPLRRMLGRLCECVPFSVSEGLYVLAAMGFLAFLVLGVRAVVRSRHRSGTVYALVLGLGNAVLTVYVLFCLLWGANYYADSFTDKSGIDVGRRICSLKYRLVFTLFASRCSNSPGYQIHSAMFSHPPVQYRQNKYRGG